MGLKGDGGQSAMRFLPVLHRMASLYQPRVALNRWPQRPPLWSKTDHGFSLMLIAVAVAGI
jgi:hypothetical protein